MRLSRRVLAIVGGLLVSLLLVVVVEVVAPAQELESGTVKVTYNEFRFAQSTDLAVVDAKLRMTNEGGVPITINVTRPSGVSEHFELAPGAMQNATLSERGTYTFGVSPYEWSSASITVRSGNPVVRFFEDLF